MLRKIKRLFSRKKVSTERVGRAREALREALEIEIRVENARQAWYNQGMRDGLAIAREQAQESLRRALQDGKEKNY